MYKIGFSTDYGAYFSWGNSVPHFSNGSGGFEDGYNWGTSDDGVYASTPGASVAFVAATGDADYEPDSVNDGAHELLGSDWRVPSNNEFQELLDNTDHLWTTINGVNGVLFMKKSDHSVYIFLPAGGYGTGRDLTNLGTFGRYWTSSLFSKNDGYRLGFSANSVQAGLHAARFGGYPIRPVKTAL